MGSGASSGLHSAIKQATEAEVKAAFNGLPADQLARIESALQGCTNVGRLASTRVASTPRDVLLHWYGTEDRSKLSDPDYVKSRMGRWFFGEAPDQAELIAQFEQLTHAAGRGELTDGAWQNELGMLAQVLLLDQLSREMWRGTRQAFAYDRRCQQLTHCLLEKGSLRWEQSEAMFMITCLMHSEDLVDHDVMFALMDADERLRSQHEVGKSHHDVLLRFGRYPHRNQVLGRISTPAEQRWSVDEAPLWARSQTCKDPVGTAAVVAGQGDQRVKLISLDCNGTLFTFSDGVGALYRGAAARALPDEEVPSAEAIEAAFDESFVAIDSAHPMFGHGKMTSREWFELLVNDIFERCGVGNWKDDGRMERAHTEIWNFFKISDAYRTYEDALPFLRWAAREGLVVAIVSNSSEVYRDTVLPMLAMDPMVHFGVSVALYERCIC